MPRDADPDAPIEVRYVRTARPGRVGKRVQEWRSDLTGRAFEVAEHHAYAVSDELREGDRGYVRYVGGWPVVMERPDARPAFRAADLARAVGREAGRSEPRGIRRAGSWVVPAMIGALVVVIAWALLR